MLFKRLQATLHRKKYSSILSYYSWDNIAQVKSLCNVVQEARDNPAQEKNTANVALILLGQHCTGKILVQYCPGGSRQHCTGKNTAQCCLNDTHVE